ncbi:MAG: transcriptional regulator [Myxococcales bacterium]|nr:transcriptional regulator [Myxococcales bacterium]
MFKERSTYTDFLRAGEGIATNILADRLARLGRAGIITRERAGDRPGSHYRLTPKGIDLLPILLEIIAWSAKYDPDTAAPRAFVRRVHRERAALGREIRRALRGRKQSATKEMNS